MQIIGTDEKPVRYSVDKNRNIIWSRNASADVKTYGNALLSVGSKSSLDRIINNHIKTHIIVSSDVRENGNRITYGETVQGNNSEADNYGKMVKHIELRKQRLQYIREVLIKQSNQDQVLS